jgi:hypothetical protein
LGFREAVSVERVFQAALAGRVGCVARGEGDFGIGHAEDEYHYFAFFLCVFETYLACFGFENK